MIEEAALDSCDTHDVNRHSWHQLIPFVAFELDSHAMAQSVFPLSCVVVIGILESAQTVPLRVLKLSTVNTSVRVLLTPISVGLLERRDRTKLVRKLVE
jgi:hypothetical protein